MTTTLSPVTLKAVDGPGRAERTPALEDLYRGFEQEPLVPLWTEIGDLMPTSPRPAAQAHLWFCERLHAERVQVDGPPA
jgi:gentisate 1,2-dioxygenase